MMDDASTAPGSALPACDATGTPPRAVGRIARLRRWLAAPLLAGALAGAVAGQTAEPSYRAEARLRLEMRGMAEARRSTAQGQFDIIHSREFARQALQKAGLVERLTAPSASTALLPFTPALAATHSDEERALRLLESNLSLATSLDGRATIGFTAGDGRLAADVANAMADSYVDLRRSFADEGGPTVALSRAVTPRQPLGLSPLWWGLGAGLAGFALTLLAQTLWRRRPRGATASVPEPAPEKVPQAPIQHLPWIGLHPEESDEAEPAPRRLRFHREGELADLTRLVRLRGAAARLVLVTGPTQDEGTARCALALGRSLAAHETRVVIVCLDVVASALGELTEDPRAPGLIDLLFGVASFSDAIHRETLSRCHVIPPGRGARDATGLVGADRLGLILRALEQTYDHVVVAAPPLAPIADAGRVAALNPTTILVTQPGALATDAVQAFDALAAQGFGDIAMVTFAEREARSLSIAA